MALRFAGIFTLVTVVFGTPGIYQPTILKGYVPAVVKTIAAAPLYKKIEHNAPAQYDFTYSVHDGHTGDIKSQYESRKGDAVHGRYELIEPDGHRRIVDYTADDHNGFNAVVHREDSEIKIPQPLSKVHKFIAPVHKVIYAAPVTKLAYSAPVAKVAYAAPIPKVAYVAPVPVVHKIVAAPVAKVLTHVAPVHYSDGHESSHVTFHGSSVKYHY